MMKECWAGIKDVDIGVNSGVGCSLGLCSLRLRLTKDVFIHSPTVRGGTCGSTAG